MLLHRITVSVEFAEFVDSDEAQTSARPIDYKLEPNVDATLKDIAQILNWIAGQ